MHVKYAILLDMQKYNELGHNILCIYTLCKLDLNNFQSNSGCGSFFLKL